MLKVYLVMEWGDDYHGSRPVSVFITDDKAKEYAKSLNENQVRDCGSETCDHKYSYTVHELPYDPYTAFIGDAHQSIYRSN